MSGETVAVIIGQAVLLITTLAGLWNQAYREARNRRWSVEDRSRIASSAIEHANQISRSVHSKIDENTKISTDAFHEANQVNKKIADLRNDMLNNKEDSKDG